MKYLFLSLILLLINLNLFAGTTKVEIKIIQTTDIHANIFPYDFIKKEDGSGSLARVNTFIKEQKNIYGDNLILVDCGDILQGQPTAYYYNFIDTTSKHIVSQVMNFMGYDIGVMGNHDIETGHSVYDKWVGECQFPILGANIIDKSTGKPYLKPYTILERDGVKIAFLGLITPAIPSWLPEKLWSGLQFNNMVETAKEWMEIIKLQENPDAIVGVFHSGQSGNMLDGVIENASLEVAKQVPGFDVVMMGHDHTKDIKSIENIAGDTVFVIDPAANANLVSDIQIRFIKENGKIISKEISGNLIDVNQYSIDKDFMLNFSEQYKKIDSFVSRRIGSISKTISCQDAFFGSSAFIDFIHYLQLSISGADISFAAPLSPSAKLVKGDIFVADMFNLYKYENTLYTMELTGQEIKDFLEMSYALWTNVMSSADDDLLLLYYPNGDKSRAKFVNMSFNFDSAAGIDYLVDVSKPEGEKLTILKMSDGRQFDLNEKYKVAINSYRGNGGGGLLTKGAGISKEELSKRIINATDKDFRYYMMNYIEERGEIAPKIYHNWKFIPKKWVKKAAKRDRMKL